MLAVKSEAVDLSLGRSAIDFIDSLMPQPSQVVKLRPERLVEAFMTDDKVRLMCLQGRC